MRKPIIYAAAVLLLIWSGVIIVAQQKLRKDRSLRKNSSNQTSTWEGPARRFDSWRVIGPGGGGTMISPTISPHDPNVVVEHCDMTGGYLTTDGARSWRMFNLRGVIRFFVFDPSLPGVIYAQNNNLWRSRDNGATWSLVWPAASSLQGISMASDHRDESVVSAHNPLDTITALAIDPHDSNHLYSSAGGTSPGLFESADAGVHWTRTVDLPELANRMWIRPGPAAWGRATACMAKVAASISPRTQVSTGPCPSPAISTYTMSLLNLDCPEPCMRRASNPLRGSRVIPARTGNAFPASISSGGIASTSILRIPVRSTPVHLAGAFGMGK